MWRIAFTIALLAASSSAAANKCGFRHYVVSGELLIQDDSTSPADLDIRVQLFLGNRSYSSDYPLTKRQDYVSPDMDGRFEIDAWASSEMDESPGKCRLKPYSGDLVISGIGIRSVRLNINFIAAKGSRDFVPDKNIRIEVVPIE